MMHVHIPARVMRRARLERAAHTFSRHLTRTAIALGGAFIGLQIAGLFWRML